MTHSIDTCIKKTYEEFQYFSHTRIDFVDITLSLLMWKMLSDDVNGRGPGNSQVDWRSPGEDYLFDVVMAHAGKRDIKYEFELSTEMWERENPELLNGLLKIRVDQLSYIPHERWIRICHIWMDFFNMQRSYTSDGKNAIVKTFDFLESFLAERMETTEAYTPREVVDLIIEFVKDKASESIYDPFCRSGDMLAAAASRLKKVRRADGGTPTKISWKLAKLRMLLLDTRVDTSIERHGSMHLPDNKKKYDVVFLNPPFGIANSVNRTVNPIGDWSRFVDGTKRMDMIFLAHSLDRLNVKGSMAAIMPNIFLSGQGLVKELRRKLVEGNLLEAVVTLPPRIFSNTGVLTAILFLNKRKETKDIFMLNASELVYKKGQQFYFEGEKAIELFHQRDNLIATQKDDRIRFVTNEEIAAHDYDLQFSSYKRKQDTFLENIEPSSILMQECTQLEEELGEVRMRLAQLIATHIN